MNDSNEWMNELNDELNEWMNELKWIEWFQIFQILDDY